MAADMRRMISDPENYVRRCTWTCVIGPDGFVEGRYGIVWDFFNKIDGYIQPQDYSEPIQPWLNFEHFMEQMPDTDDQEILAMLE